MDVYIGVCKLKLFAVKNRSQRLLFKQTIRRRQVYVIKFDVISVSAMIVK